MAEPNQESSKSDAKAARQARKAEEERRAAEELRRRKEQLETTKNAKERLEAALQKTKDEADRRQALVSHLEGFYAEIDKLTKGKAIFEATDLVVEQANFVIHDAKDIFKGDIYLDRTKEFVPAGTNPQFQDVLVTLRTVQQSLERCKTQQDSRRKNLTSLMRDCKTIVAALELYISDTESMPSKEDVQSSMEGAVSPTWFAEFEDDDGDYFDFDKLDRCDLNECLSENLNRKDSE